MQAQISKKCHFDERYSKVFPIEKSQWIYFWSKQPQNLKGSKFEGDFNHWVLPRSLGF